MKKILRFFGSYWCLFVHGIVQDKHEMKVAYGPFHCKACGRIWEL